MSRKSKVLLETKLAVVEDYLRGLKSIGKISDELSVDASTVESWIKIYRSKGKIGLTPKEGNAVYSKELKISAVKEYLSGNGSLWDISLKYGLRSKNQLRNWIMKYTSHEEFKSPGSGGNQIMTKGRATTLAERIAIVEYCIENGKNYNEVAKKYQVSYQQVRSWVIKFEESGIDALSDRRGKPKPEEQLTEVEKLRAEMKLLEAKNKRLEMENLLLKKLKEIERGRR